MTTNEMILIDSYLIACEKGIQAGYEYLMENGYEFEPVAREVKNKNRVYFMKRNAMRFELGKKDGAKWIALPLDGTAPFMISKAELENECTKIKL